MWQIVYIASNKEEVDKLKKYLVAEGFLVKVKEISDGYQILVPEGEAIEVADIISQGYDY